MSFGRSGNQRASTTSCPGWRLRDRARATNCAKYPWREREPSVTVSWMIRVSVGSVSSTPTSSRTSRRRPSSVRSPRSRRPPGVNHGPPSGSGLTRTRTIAPRPSWISPPAAQKGARPRIRRAGSSGEVTRVRLTIGTRPNRAKASPMRSLHSPGHIAIRRTETLFERPPSSRLRTRCVDASRGRFRPSQQSLRHDEVRRHHLGGQDARRRGHHEDVETPEELRPHGAPRTPSEGLRETPGAGESRGILAHQVRARPFSARAAERRGNQDRQNRGRVSFDRDLLRVLLSLSPRNALADARPAEAPVPLRRRRDVDRVIEAAPELVPPDRVVLAYASADHERSRLSRIEDDVRKLRLVPKLVDRERLVLLPEGPQLVADRAVEDRGYVDGDLVLPGPP